ncbi:MAG: TIGR01777 family oxidoreductase [bacterium]|nr:TIGR01777 family oxidoreductase [bacterium]
MSEKNDGREFPSGNILLVGGSGLIGRELEKRLIGAGYQVFRVNRHSSSHHQHSSLANEICWDLMKPHPDYGLFADFKAVISLAGAGIADRRWSAKRKQELRQSRVEVSRVIVSTLNQPGNEGVRFICASAVGIYGNRGDQVLTEDSPVDGSSFLGRLASDWEAEVAQLVSGNFVQARFGVVLSSAGGALKKMLTPFRLGLGGPLGSGRQFMSWIAIDDAVAALMFLIEHREITGPVNLVSPNPVSNREFAHALAKTLHRPCIFPVPGFVLQMLLGEMADALLLSGCRVQPKRLLEAGFTFQYADLLMALRKLLSQRITP